MNKAFKKVEKSPKSPPEPVRVGLGVVILTKTEHSDTFGAAAGRANEPLILITKRRPDTVYAGFWEFPGGKADPHERLAECVARELREELGIEVELLEPLQTVSHNYDHASVELSPWLCRLAPGSPQPRNLQVAEHRWAALSELESVQFPEGNAPIVREVLERLARP